MPLLILGSVRQIAINYGRPGFFLLSALIMSLAGDIFMAMEGEEPFFILGLSAFLIAHMLYVVTFRRSRADNHEVLLTKKLPLLLFLFIGLALFIFALLKPSLESMAIPVFVYVVAITLMALAALNRYGKAGLRSFWRVLFGALLFMASDMIIAYNKFVEGLDYGQYLILGLYITAQWLIVSGIVMEERKNLS